MANAPDTLWVSGPNLAQVAPASVLITPTGSSTQTNLGALVGAVVGASAIGGAYGTLETTADNLTAHASGGQTNALLLPAAINRGTTVANAADSVKLPPSVAGISVVLINDAATNALQAFGSGTDTIDGVATATGIAVSAAKRVFFFCVTAGAWQSLEGVKAV